MGVSHAPCISCPPLKNEPTVMIGKGYVTTPLLVKDHESHIVLKALGRVKSGMQHPSYGGRYKSPPSVDVSICDEGTWEGEVWHAAPLLRRELQKSPQCRCFHL